MRARWSSAENLAVGGLCGLLAGGVALGVASLVAVFVRPEADPVIAVGEGMIDRTPEWLKEFAIQHFGTHDKQVLLGGLGLTVTGLAIVIGIVARRWIRAGMAGLGLFGLVGALAALDRPASDLTDALPSLVGVAFGLTALALLTQTATAATRLAPVISTNGDFERHDAERRYFGRIGIGGDATDKPGGSATDKLGSGDAGNLGTDGGTEGGTESGIESGTDNDPDGTDTRAAEPALSTRTGSNRRRFLLVAGATVAVGAFSGVLGRVLSAARSVDAARRAVRLPRPTDTGPAIPPGSDLRIPGLTPFTTANSGFYRVDTALVLPQVDPGSWSLRVHGMVDHPLELSFEELLRRPMLERDITLACVSNQVGGQYAGNARWLGASLRDLLKEAGVRHGADQVLSRSADGMTISTPLAAIMGNPDAMLAVGMNGQPLPIAHGFPVRMVVPGLYGYVSATKWVVDLKVTTFAAGRAYWTVRGYADNAPVKTFSRIDVPRPLSHLAPGRHAIAGVAWAQTRGITAVQVRVDNGPWTDAVLAPVPSTETWRQWVLEWDATPGEHTLQVRATDATGATQPQTRVPPFPNGATGWHSIVVTVG